MAFLSIFFSKVTQWWLFLGSFWEVIVSFQSSPAKWLYGGIITMMIRAKTGWEFNRQGVGCKKLFPGKLKQREIKRIGLGLKKWEITPCWIKNANLIYYLVNEVYYHLKILLFQRIVLKAYYVPSFVLEFWWLMAKDNKPWHLSWLPEPEWSI